MGGRCVCLQVPCIPKETRHAAPHARSSRVVWVVVGHQSAACVAGGAVWLRKGCVNEGSREKVVCREEVGQARGCTREARTPRRAAAGRSVSREGGRKKARESAPGR